MIIATRSTLFMYNNHYKLCVVQGLNLRSRLGHLLYPKFIQGYRQGIAKGTVTLLPCSF